LIHIDESSFCNDNFVFLGESRYFSHDSENFFSAFLCP
jgi:hypothetical protein